MFIPYPQTSTVLLQCILTVYCLPFVATNAHTHTHTHTHTLKYCNIIICRSQWPRGLSRRPAAFRLLRLWVRIPPEAWMSVCCECCVSSGRGLCDELITRPEESYRLWCVVVCNLETSWMRSHTQWIVIELNRRCITGCIFYMPFTVTAKHDFWMSSDRLQFPGDKKTFIYQVTLFD